MLQTLPAKPLRTAEKELAKEELLLAQPLKAKSFQGVKSEELRMKGRAKGPRIVCISKIQCIKGGGTVPKVKIAVPEPKAGAKAEAPEQKAVLPLLLSLKAVGKGKALPVSIPLLSLEGEVEIAPVPVRRTGETLSRCLPRSEVRPPPQRRRASGHRAPRQYNSHS